MKPKKKSEKKKKKAIVKKPKEKKETNKILPSKNIQEKYQKKILMGFFILSGIILVIIVGFYFYTNAIIYSNYKGIDFEAKKIGEILFYETTTLAVAHDGKPFGFRLRTNPSILKKINFENVDNLKFTKINGYRYEEDFNCKGKTTISMVNLKRLYERMGMSFIRDNESNCDPQGRYNYFILKYGDKTEIKKIGPKCYNIIVKGNKDECEILPATEKLMVELFSKYLILSNSTPRR